MKNIRHRIRAAFVFAPLLFISAFITPAAAQLVGTGQVEAVRVDFVSATTVRISWDQPPHSAADASGFAYVVQLATGTTAWVDEGGQAGRYNNVPARDALGQTEERSPPDAATPTGVKYFNACNVLWLPAFNPAFSVTDSATFVCSSSQQLAASYQGFTAGETYRVRVRGYSARPVSQSFGKFSDDVVFTIPTTAALGALTLREPSDIGDAGFTVNWTPAANAESYVIRWRTAANAGPDRRADTTDDVAAGPWQNAAGNDAECNDGDANNDGECGEPRPLAPDFYRLTGLAARTAYDYEVRAVNTTEAGSWVPAASPVGMPLYPITGVAAGITAPRADFLRAGVTARSGVATPNLRVLWDAPTTAAGDYAIVPQVRVQGGDAWTGISGVNSAATAQAALQLPPGAKSAEIASPPADHAGADITGLAADTMYEVRLVVFGRVTELDAFTATDTEATDAITARTNNNISTLSALTATNLLRITPPFMPTMTSYFLLQNGINRFQISATPTDPAASVSGDDDTTASLFGETGVTDHTVTVTAEDGVTTTGYMLRLGIPPESFAIESITYTSGGDPLPISPAVDRTVFAYNAGAGTSTGEVPAAVQSVDIDLNWTNGGSSTTIALRGQPESAAFGPRAVQTVPLAFGENHIDIAYANAGKSPLIYTITITRSGTGATAAATPTLAAPSGITSDGFTVNWARQPNANGYRIRWRTAPTTTPVAVAGPWQDAAGNDAECNDGDANNDGECGEEISGGFTTAYAITGLTSQTSYDYSVRALGPGGDSTWSNTTTADTLISADTSLSELRADGGDDMNLVAFAAATTSYNLGAIRFGVDQLDITATVAHIAAAITAADFNGTAVEPLPTNGAEFSIDISAIPQNAIATGKVTISVTAEDETSTSEYVILFTRARARAPDVNGDTAIDDTDGLLIARYLIGLRGGALIAGLADAADGANIEARLKAEKDAAVPAFDVNGDSKVTAADGILIARYLLGVESGVGLTEGQVSAADAADVAGNIERLRISPAAQAQ